MDDLGNVFRENLRGNLSPEEQQELAALITPRMAQLCVKAFGEEVAELFMPYLQDDIEAGRMSAQDVQELQGIQSIQGVNGNGMV